MSELQDAPIALTAMILKNKGVPVPVYRTQLVTDTNDDGEIVSKWMPKVLVEGTDTTETVYEVHDRHVRFDANAFASLEEVFGDLGQFEEAMRVKVYSTVRAALAICWGWQPDRAGAAMKEDEVQTYATATGVALAMANGVDPTKAAEMLKMGFEAVAEAKVQIGTQVDEMLAEAKPVVPDDLSTLPTTAESIGDSGLPTGSEPVEPIESSGS